MSQILRDKNDIYNFSDQSSTPRRRRAHSVSHAVSHTVSLTSTTTKAIHNKKESKYRCDTLKSVLSTAVWVTNEHYLPDEKSGIDSVIALIGAHLESGCRCVDECSLRLLLANTYQLLFMFNLHDIDRRVAKEEDEKKCDDVQIKSYINDIPVRKSSKFDSFVLPHIVNVTNMLSLVNPLKRALNEWKTAVMLGNKSKTLTDATLVKLRIYYNICAAYYAFGFYDMHKYQLKAALLLEKLCRYYTDSNAEIRLTSCYCLLKIYINLGSIQTAISYLNKSKVNVKLKPETFGSALVFLAKCELDLLTQTNSLNSAKLLKEFLQSDYLKKATINRYYIKGLALLLASKYNGIDYDFSESYQEFIEPIQMAICILKRWHPFLSNKRPESNPKNNTENMNFNAGDLDPIWYRFAIIEFAFISMQLSAKFYINIGMPNDATFYYNNVLSLARRHCVVLWQTKFLIIGSQLDMICDLVSSSQTKLANASLSIICSSSLGSERSVFSSSTISPETKRIMYGRIIKSTDIEILDDSAEEEVSTLANLECLSSNDNCHEVECDHENLNYWNIGKNLMKSKPNRVEEENEILFHGEPDLKSLTKFDPSDEEVFRSNELLELFLIRYEIDFCGVILENSEYSTTAYKLNVLSNKYLNSIETFISNTLKLNINDIINMGKNSHKVTDQELALYSLARGTKLKLIKSLVKLHIKNNNYTEALKLIREMTPYSTYSYEHRMIVAQLMFLEAFCLYGLWQKDNSVKSYIWLKYDSSFTESVDNLIDSIRTPSPKQRTNKSMIPRAPKQKKLYKTQEMQDYVVALKKAVCEEKMNKKSDDQHNECHQNKLNLESESTSRSVSLSDFNNIKKNVSVSDVIVDEEFCKQIINPNQRITRSKALSLKMSDESNGNRKSVNERAKNVKSKSNSTQRSTNSSSNNDIEISGDYNDDFNEVFLEKLCINDNDETTEKLLRNKEDRDINSIISILSKILRLTSTHPSVKLYLSIQELLMQIYSSKEKLNEEAFAYHFCESANSVSYRYKNLFIIEKKKKMKYEHKYSIESLVFNKEKSILDFTKELPLSWRVVQMRAVENGTNIPDLQVCRYQNGKKPIFLLIKGNSEKIVKHFMTQFNEIIKNSNASIVNKDRETFWRLRFSLDEELRILLRSVEETWFGPFIGILFGEMVNDNYLSFCSNLKSIFLEYAAREHLICAKQELLDVIIESLPSLKYIDFKTAMKILFDSCSLNFIYKCYSKYEELFCSFYPIENSESIFTTNQLSAVGLILDNSFENFPFESLPSLLTYNQSIFRIPSLRILSLMVSTFKDNLLANGIDEKSVYYVLNPSNNLAKTEEYFKEAFLSTQDWNGVIGTPPDPLQLKNALENKDLYIFFGHGAGASYYRLIPEGIDSVNINCASLVVGCSSGKLFSDGKQLESYGNAYRFMMNGSACYVGVLWDVTDKDIDKFSDYLLSYSMKNWKCKDCENTDSTIGITNAVCKSRSVCKLKYLIGASPVVYGLPLFAKRV